MKELIVSRLSIFLCSFALMTVPADLFGQGWSTVIESETKIFHAVWGSSENDIFAVGEGGMICHYDGTDWQLTESGTSQNLLAIWGSSGSNIFAAGDHGTLLHYDGALWRTLTSLVDTTLRAIWGSSSTDIFAVGDDGIILCCDGTGWRQMDSGTDVTLCALWGSSGTNVFAVGGGGTILRYNGTDWLPMDSGTTLKLLTVQGGTGADVFAAGSGVSLYYNGRDWTTTKANAQKVRALWGTSGSDMFGAVTDAVQGKSFIRHYKSDTKWQDTEIPVPAYGLWGTSASEIFAVGGNRETGGTLLRYDGESWETVWQQSARGQIRNLWSLWVGSDTEIIAAGDDGTLLQYDGASWQLMDSPADRDLLAIGGASGTDLFAVGESGIILHYDGTEWQLMPGPVSENLNGLWTCPTEAVPCTFAVGNSGTLLRFDGKEWQTLESPTRDNLNEVWGASATDVFAVGYGGTLLHYDGEQWKLTESGTDSNLRGIWGSSGSDVFAVGDLGIILHYDGLKWTQVEKGSGYYDSIWGRSNADVFAVGGSGLIRHYDGRIWQTLESGIEGTLRDVRGAVTAAGSDVFAVEWHGAILRYSAFELSLPESLQEGETVSATGTISLRSTPEHDLNIALITDMPSAVTIPAAVVIPAGQTSVSFPLTARDNASSDATRTLLVTASANGCNAGNRFIRIYDDETAELITEMPSAVAEDDGLISGGGTVRISASLPTDLTISLTSDAPHVIRVPQSVTVPAGEDRAAFDVMVTDDAEIDGPETVQITASVRGWTSGSASVTVTDNDQYRLNLILPETADEGDGVLSGAGQVEVPVPFDGDITVALFSDDLSEMRVPEAVTIPAGQTVAAFDLTPIRDALIDGSQTAVLSASASGFPGTRASVEITDADGRWDDVTRGTNKLRDIWGSSPDNVYAVGSDGLIFHYDGTAWQPEQNITTAPLRGIWGSGPSDIFAAGNDGTILRYDGRQWQKMPTHTDETFYAVWGSSAKNVFAVGGKSNTGGIILQYDGSEWREMVTGLRGPLNTIWGNSENDIFAAGDKGQILHYDGTEWRETDSGTDDTIKSLWGSSGSDVFAVGSGLVLHYNGTEWQPMDGAAGQNLRAIWGDSSDNVFAVGGSGLILHYDGTEWREMECPTDEPLWAVWGSSGKNVFVAGGDCAIAGFDGKTWTMSKDSDNYYRGVWGCPAETGPGYTAFMVGDDGLIVQYDGSDLTVMEKGFYPDLNSIWGRSATDIYAVGDDGLILRFDGVRWHRMDSGGFFESLRGVWGLPSEQGEDVFAVGDDGRILRFDGVEWHRMESGTDTDLTGIRGTSGSDIFVVGKKCIILHYDGAEWKQMETDTGRNLNAVWGSSGDSVWAAGDSGLLHYDGIRWRQPDSPLSNPLYGLWGRCASDLFAVGSSVILHYDGEEWTEMDGPSTPLDGVWGEDNGEIVVVGRYNTIVRFSPVGIEIPETVAEGDGLLEGQGRVYIRQSSDTDLAVTLTSHDTTEITVPTEITIPAGETDAIFDLTVREDDLWDGTQRVMVTASAPGSHLGTGFIRIRDNESAPLSVQLPGQASESDGVLAEAGSVTLSQTAGKAVTVSLASDDPKVSVPENITVPAGQTGALFDLTILDETVFDGDRFVTVTASVDGWIPGSAVIEVSDNEVTELSLETAEAASEDITGTKSSLSGVTSVSENDGEVPVILSVPGILADDLEVALSSDQPDLISPDATVILPAGAQSVRFPLSITDNAETDGSRIVTVSAAAPGWISATIDIEITDDDPGTLRFGSARYMVREEAGSAEIGVVRELSDSGRIEISYASSDGTAFADTDYRPVSGTLVFEDGETRKIISVPLMADAETEGGERFYLSLENPLGGAVRGTPDTAEIIIADDMTWVSYAGDVTKHHLRGLWGGSDTDVFAVGWQGTILHWNGKGWEDMSLESGTAVAFEGIWGSSGKNVFAVGQDGTIFHYDGSSWTPLERKTERPLYAVWGDSGADIFVGGSGVLLHCDGKKWQKTDVGTADIRGIWGDSATDIFAVGCDGAILHYDGTEWLPMESGTADHLYSVWGDSGTDVFAAGAYGTIVHYNGTEWTPMAGPDQFVLYLDAVWGASGSDVLAAGWGGTVLRYDGTDWKALHRETDAGLHALWGPSGTGAALDVFAVGENGEVRHYTPSSE